MAYKTFQRKYISKYEELQGKLKYYTDTLKMQSNCKDIKKYLNIFQSKESVENQRNQIMKLFKKDNVLLTNAAIIDAHITKIMSRLKKIILLLEKIDQPKSPTKITKRIRKVLFKTPKKTTDAQK